MTASAPTESTPDTVVKPTFWEAFWVWAKIGVLSFGGPAGQIALMHRIVVEEKRWVEDARFLHALNYCMLLPGPEAQQLATYLGWLMHGLRGGLVAGLWFVIPGAFVILALSYLYVWYQSLPLLTGLFLGIKACVLVIVLHALQRIAQKVLKNGVMRFIAAIAFLGIFVGDLPFPLIVLGAGVVGFLGARAGDERFLVLASHGDAAGAAVPRSRRKALIRSAWVVGIGVVLWFAPIGIAGWWLGPNHVFVTEGIFFSKLAVVTFGGAYAVLAYMAQQAVEAFGWLSAGEMLDGLGLAESTPGPLIMVTQFVGFLAAYRNANPLEPEIAALIGSALTVWVTFVPCFIWIFLGAPYVERMRSNVYATAALSAITAAVVGVILNLAVWFGLHVLFANVDTHAIGPLRVLIPAVSSIDWVALGLALIAGLALLRFHVSVFWTLLLSAVLGVLVTLL